MRSTPDFKRVYVWEGPVRIFHWLNALSITVLIITGFLIADPPAIMSGKEASNQYLFGTVRFIHFTAAYTMVAVILLRVYWAFAGNKYAGWRSFFPFHKEGWKNMLAVIKHDILLIPDKQGTHVSIGHNAVASVSYLVLFVMIFIMIFTGFGLYSDNATWWFPQLFSWVVPALGGDFMARTIHHVTMWGILLFIPVHVYLVLYHDWMESRGEVSSMISGFKFIEKMLLKRS